MREGARVIATDLDAGKARRPQGRQAWQARRALDRAVEALAEGRGARIRRARRAGQLRGLRAPRQRARLLRADWDFSFDLNVKSMHRTHPGVPAGHAEEEERRDRQHLVRGVVDPRRARPLRLWRDQGRRHRADQGGRRRLHQAGHPGERDLPRHDRDRPRSKAASRTARKRPARSREEVERAFIERQPMGRLGTPLRKWRGLRFSRPPTRRATSPARRISSTAGWRCSPRLGQ